LGPEKRLTRAARVCHIAGPSSRGAKRLSRLSSSAAARHDLNVVSAWSLVTRDAFDEHMQVVGDNRVADGSTRARGLPRF
jgi:hypothetical protein